ncbi:DUF1415 domain-containing protein [Aquincola sp. MAHUQ-54]|uniref:DUF1415 domain-containing protein n=1 Tax=Aquincola agrisoli TaxID=3119538 RepID=A0AAW9Q8K4_9BURK
MSHPPPMGPRRSDADAVVAATRAWLEHAVIGLNLCPFAKAVHVRGQVRYAVSDAADTHTLLEALRAELLSLAAADPAQVDTCLLVHPGVLNDFDDYNQFLGAADALLAQLGLDGELQIASFHPHYRFAGTEADDVTNATNQSPYPMLHLLREASIDRAVAAFPEPEAIYESNMRTLQAMGPDGWAALRRQWEPAAQEPPPGGTPRD